MRSSTLQNNADSPFRTLQIHFSEDCNFLFPSFNTILMTLTRSYSPWVCFGKLGSGVVIVAVHYKNELQTRILHWYWSRNLYNIGSSLEAWTIWDSFSKEWFSEFWLRCNIQRIKSECWNRTESVQKPIFGNCLWSETVTGQKV